MSEATVLTNYIPKYYFQDDLDDSGWGCGWRCIQMLLSQIDINKNIFDIAYEIKDIVGEDISIDLDSKKINMADIYWIMLYMSGVGHQLGHTDTEFEMFTIENMSQINNLYDKLQMHFLLQKSLVVVTAGGATALIAGVKPATDENLFDVYLVDPHTSSIDVDFNKLKGFGEGGRGWTNVRNVILKGKEKIGIEDDDEFLMNSSCLFGFLQNLTSV